MKLELVTDFAKLSTGMIVALMPCGRCDSTHLSRLGRPGRAANGLNGFAFEPPPACLGGARMLCTSLAVKNRRIYRVLPKDEAADRGEEKSCSHFETARLISPTSRLKARTQLEQPGPPRSAVPLAFGSRQFGVQVGRDG